MKLFLFRKGVFILETEIYQEADIAQAAAQLKKGELVAFPTETVYGLGANALLPESVKQVFEVKGRPSDNPLIVHVNEFSMVEQFVDTFHPLTKKIVDQFWPGPLTLIFTIIPGSLPDVVTGGLKTAAFRMPDNAATLELIRKAGVPIVGPSANTSGKPSPTSASHVYHDFNRKIMGILDDGPTKIGVESTVLDLSGAVPMILRPGAVTQAALSDFLGVAVTLDKHLVKESETPKSPGMKYKHYSPNTKVLLVHEGDFAAAIDATMRDELKFGLLADKKIITNFGKQANLTFSYKDNSIESATRGLFAGLRALDERGLDIILAQAYPEKGLGIAYMNRAKKAAAQNIFKNS